MVQRLSESTKRARGTSRPSRQKQTPVGERLTEAPLPPASLSAGAADEWHGLSEILVGTGVLTAADLPALALLAETLAHVRDLADTIRREGLTIPGASGAPKQHPGIAALATARAQAGRLFAAFGLTPQSRASVDQAPDGDDPEDPAAAYFR